MKITHESGSRYLTLELPEAIDIGNVNLMKIEGPKEFEFEVKYRGDSNVGTGIVLDNFVIPEIKKAFEAQERIQEAIKLALEYRGESNVGWVETAMFDRIISVLKG
jgi:hypothetical protein